MNRYKIIYQRHAVERMAWRGFSEEDIEHVLLTGEAIEIYPDDYPYPSELMLGWRNTRPIHIVVATDETGQRKIVITVYEPAPKKWDRDFKRRRS